MPQKLDESARGVYLIAATPFSDDEARDLESTDRVVDPYLRAAPRRQPRQRPRRPRRSFVLVLDDYHRCADFSDVHELIRQLL